MGCFDTVMVPCPKCGERSSFQTKSGPCCLDIYDMENAPDSVLEDVNRHSPNECEKCGEIFEVAFTDRMIKIPRSVKAEKT